MTAGDVSQAPGDASFSRVEELFHAALDVPRPERAAFLAARADGDAALIREVEALLDADDGADGFLGAGDMAALAANLVGGALPRRLGPYRLLEVAGQGGMGVVYRAERADGAFDQRVAVKMLRPGPATEGLVARFLAERRVLARLEHPSIARVLDAGADEHGAPWLAMEYVEGVAIDRWCDERRLDVTARVRLFVDVVAAVAHAHEQLVVHRDLKPANVLVDADGRPRLLDFGIAKVLADEPAALDATRVEERAMTPAYASPEQLRGEPVGPRSDVYQLGVVLHELLAGGKPYKATTESRIELERAITAGDVVAPSARLRAESRMDPATAERIAATRSTTVRALCRRLGGDLDRIVLQALRVEPARRYASAADFARDLERWLGGLPVAARGDGLGYRASKLLRRRPVESALVALLAIGAASGAGVFVRQSFRLADQLDTIERLADAQRLEELEREVEELWPATPDRSAAFDEWLSRARVLEGRRALHDETRERLRREDPDADVETRTWRAWQAARLDELIAGIDRIAAPDPFGPTIASVELRRERAATLYERSIGSHASEWAAARERIRAHTRYGGLDVAPQLGLVPLGPDPDGGLEAFWPVETGARPHRDAAGRFVPAADAGLVLLLVPGGIARIGAQRTDPLALHHDPMAEPDEEPVHEVRLDPFFVSKYETTQSQWIAWTGSNPSEYAPGSRIGGGGFTLVHPVEQVSWIDAGRVLGRYGLHLPTEVQWEYAARAGTHTPWSSGADERSLAGHANLADLHARENGGAPAWTYSTWLDDGHTVHAPVGTFRPNPFGLHDVHGNVWEWVRDGEASYADSAREGDGARRESPGERVLARGGGFFNPPAALRSSERYAMRPEQATRSLGLRAARVLDP